MQPTQAAIGAYRSAMMTTPPLQGVVLLYDGILLHIAQAAQANRDSNFERQFDEVMKAARIIEGLSRCLDLEAGGTVAANLRDFYETIGRGLMRSTGRNYGADFLVQLADSVRRTRNAWAHIAGVPKTGEDTNDYGDATAEA
jgi:flagellar protein FliS